MTTKLGNYNSELLCSIAGCQRQRKALGWCQVHYMRWRNHGDPLWEPPTRAELFFAKTERKPNGCLEWTGCKNSKGYGATSLRGKPIGAHVLAWVLANGPIPEGLWVLHHCDNPPCVDIEHLWLGDNTDNQRDSSAKGRTRNGRSERTHCPQGHLYEETDYGYDTGRVCRVCKRETARRWYYAHGGSAGRRARRGAPPISD